jgi:predicted HTH domain antitoxin
LATGAVACYTSVLALYRQPSRQLFTLTQADSNRHYVRRWSRLPEELVAQLREGRDSNESQRSVRHGTFERHRVSQGKAAEILNVSRNEIFDLMTNYRVPVIDLDAEELGNELRKPLPHL